MSEPIRVLIVDDNTRYREAFARNLVAGGMQVVQAQDSTQALDLLRSQDPDVMVTDLQMRTATEGLDLIASALGQDPTLPVIMISAVGSFDEGALASKLGAAYVLSKARIEEEMAVLHDCIRQSHATRQAARATLGEIAALRAASDEDGFDTEGALRRLHEMQETRTLHPYVRSEAFDLQTELSAARDAELSQREMDRAMAPSQAEDLKRLEDILRELVPGFDQLETDTRGAVRTAEYLFQQSTALGNQFDLARTVCFSYCFSVENQAKVSVRRRLIKFLAEKESLDLVRGLIERRSNHVDMFFQQYLLQILRDRPMDFTVENVRQTFLRIIEHEVRYRPDGLKALGILLITFGRTYEFKRFNQMVRIENPLGLKGLDNDEEALRLAEILISLQHMRNPYIHPEISGREGIEKIRGMTMECLRTLVRLR